MSLDINNYYDPKNPYSKLWKNITIKNLPERLTLIIKWKKICCHFNLFKGIIF